MTSLQKTPRVPLPIQHTLAQAVVILGILAPLAGIALVVWLHRHQTVARLVGQELPVFLMLLLAVVVLIHYRRRIMDRIDRHFFREEHDTRRSLLRVTSLIQKGSDVHVLGRVMLQEIEKGLHPRHLSLWSLQQDGRNFIREIWVGENTAAPALSRLSELARLIAEQHEGFDIREIDFEETFTDGRSREWLQATGTILIVPLFVEHEMNGFLLVGERLSQAPYTADSRELLTTVAAQLALTQEHALLESIARKDPLTDVLNRHAFYSLLEKKKSSASLVTSGSVALVDLNDLKRVNDTFGHATGDYALRQVASAIRSLLRPDDLLFRWGGDEFLVIVFGLDEEIVRHRFATLDGILSESLATPSSDPIPISVSFGVARFGSVTSLHAAIDQADKTMYAYKQSRKSGGQWSVVSAQ